METKTGDYYLIARDLNTDEVFRIPIDRKWYMPHATSERIYGNDLAVIDYVTSKFTSKEQLINRLFTKHYIDTENIDLYVTRLHKYNENKYIREYDVIVNSNDRVIHLIALAMLRISNEGIETNNNIVDNLMNKFFSKCFFDDTFYELMTCTWSKVDKYVVDKIVEYKKKMESKQNRKMDWSIKYVLNDKKTSYLVLRNIISMWNTYDELIENMKDLSKEEQTKQIVKEYATRLNNQNIPKEEKAKLKVTMDKNYIEGQISMEQYMESKTNNVEQELDPYQQMLIDAEELKQESFDSIELQELEIMYGRNEVKNHLTVELIQLLSPKDKYILGFIDYVEYKNQMNHIEQKRKK